MAKVLNQSKDYMPVERRKWSVKKIAVLVFLGLVLAPILVEGVALSVAQWVEVTGTRFVFRTPILSWCGSKLEDCRQFIRETISYHYRDASWEPGFALPILAALIVIAMLMLRR